jgi:hypothetical protein
MCTDANQQEEVKKKLESISEIVEKLDSVLNKEKKKKKKKSRSRSRSKVIKSVHIGSGNTHQIDLNAGSEEDYPDGQLKLQ